jgi:hypothetical protein
MPWEIRGSKSYYYRRRRVDGRIVKTFSGSGLLGELAFMADFQRRQVREHNDNARRAERQTLSVAEKPLTTVNHSADLLLRSVLLGTGAYRQHYRGEWRRNHEDRGKASQQQHTVYVGR